MSDNAPLGDRPDWTLAMRENDGLCWVVSGEQTCILDLNHDGGHGWERTRTAPKGHRVAGICTEHADLAWLYEDGGVQCMNRLVVESSSEDCPFGPLPSEWMAGGQLL